VAVLIEKASPDAIGLREFVRERLNARVCIEAEW
jgi:hypothetical protein